MSVKFSNPRGTADILPSEIPLWHLLENTSRVLFQRYGYKEIRTPFFEDTSLFKRSLGETAEVVNKQLLGLVSGRAEAGNDNGKESPALSLRPEGTASVVRAYNQYDIGREEFLSKLFYIGPMFRGERPQKGRLRQFHQIGAEAIGRGADHPLLDAEMLVLATHILKVLGLKDFKVYINSLGTTEDKARFALWLREKLKDKIVSLNEECRVQYERNVFRLLDSKDPDCQAMIRELNIAGEHLSSGGAQYFREVCAALDVAGVPYEIAPRLVRGLDYYTHTVFEITSSGLGSQDAIGAGGRYNGLIEQLGGGDRRQSGPLGAIGFALGMERVMLALESQAQLALPAVATDVFVVCGQEALEPQAFCLVNDLRKAGVGAQMDFGRGRPLKKQFEQADRQAARFVIIYGTDEASRFMVGLKDMSTREQRLVPRDSVVNEMQRLCLGN